MADGKVAYVRYKKVINDFGVFVGFGSNFVTSGRHLIRITFFSLNSIKMLMFIICKLIGESELADSFIIIFFIGR